MTKRNPKNYGISHLSADRNYVEYLADPASQLTMACKSLLDASKIKSERRSEKPVERSTIIKHIICQSVVVFGLHGLLYHFQANMGVWVISILCTFVYGLVVWYYWVSYKERHVPEEFLHAVKVTRNSRIVGDEVETDILISLQSTIRANWNWPFGTRINHILELNEIPSLYAPPEPETKEEEAEAKVVPNHILKKILPEDEDNAYPPDYPPCYQELFLSAAMLETADLPTYSQVLDDAQEK